MRNVSLLLVVPLLLFAGNGRGDDPKKEDGVKEEMKRLEGLWLLNRTESGRFTTTSQGVSGALLFEGGKVTEGRLFPGEKNMQKFGSGPYKLDVSKNPKTIDITLKEKDKKEVTQLGIYKLDKKGDLTISLSEPGAKERPQKFNADKAPIRYYFSVKK